MGVWGWLGGGGWTILRTQVSDSPALSVHMISVGLMIYAFRLGLLWNRQLSLLLHTERYAALANLWDPNTLLFFFLFIPTPPPGGPSPHDRCVWPMVSRVKATAVDHNTPIISTIRPLSSAPVDIIGGS